MLNPAVLGGGARQENCAVVRVALLHLNREPREKFLRGLPGHLKVEGVGAKIKSVSPGKFSIGPDADASEYLIVVPNLEDPVPRQTRQIDHPASAIVKGQIEGVTVQWANGKYTRHRMQLSVVAGASIPKPFAKGSRESFYNSRITRYTQSMASKIVLLLVGIAGVLPGLLIASLTLFAYWSGRSQVSAADGSIIIVTDMRVALLGMDFSIPAPSLFWAFVIIAGGAAYLIGLCALVFRS